MKRDEQNKGFMYPLCWQIAAQNSDPKAKLAFWQDNDSSDLKITAWGRRFQGCDSLVPKDFKFCLSEGNCYL